MPDNNLVNGLGGTEGYGEITMPRGDDNTMAVDVSAVFEHGFLIDGVHYDPDEFIVSTNGFVQFGYRYAGVYPYTTHWIAPYNIDLDTRTQGTNTASGQVHVDIDAASSTVTVTWDQVGRYYINGNPSFSFQMQMTQMADGSTRITFRYGDMELDSLLRYARIGYSLDSRLDNPMDVTVTPEDFDTTPGNTGVAGVWEYLLNLQPLVGTSGADSMDGTNADDAMTGLGGRDIMRGLAGDDLINGGNGDDRMFAHGGDDILIGGRGADVLNGGAGRDTADYRGSNGVIADLLTPGDNTGDAAGDTFISIENLSGGGGHDVLAGDGGANVLIGRGGDDTLMGRGGNDTLGGRNGRDVLDGGSGDDRLFGGNGNDLLLGGAGADYMDGGLGYDTVTYENSSVAVGVDLSGALPNSGDAAGDTFFRIESVIGTNFDDTLTGGNGDERLSGGDGNDTLRGGRGNDILIGGNGDDILHGDFPSLGYSNTGSNTLIGGQGNDVFIAGLSIDVMIGGTGRDEASYLGSTSGVVVDLENTFLNSGLAAGDIFSDVEDLRGSYFDDLLGGDVQDNRLIAMRGDDELFGRAGNDHLEGRAGADILDGGAGDDSLHGGDGSDTFVYGAGADEIADFAGDRLRLDDALWGNTVLTDAQILAFASVVGGDAVFDFGGGNRLTLTGITDLTLLNGQIDVL